jgi:hypothetical protein
VAAGLPPLPPEDEALLVAVAERVARHRMEVPAVLFLESVRPLSFVGSQALVFLEPIVQSIFDWAQYQRFAALVAERDNLDRLTRHIERAADEREAAEKRGRTRGTPPNPEPPQEP